MDYDAFKAMDIKTVGERVRLAAAIKALRQECYLAASLAARTPTRVNLISKLLHNLQNLTFSFFIDTYTFRQAQ